MSKLFLDPAGSNYEGPGAHRVFIVTDPEITEDDIYADTNAYYQMMELDRQQLWWDINVPRLNYSALPEVADPHMCCAVCSLGDNYEGRGEFINFCQCENITGVPTLFHYICLCDTIIATGQSRCPRCHTIFIDPQIEPFREHNETDTERESLRKQRRRRRDAQQVMSNQSQLEEYIPPPREGEEGDGETDDQEQFVNQLKEETSLLTDPENIDLLNRIARLLGEDPQPEQSVSGIQGQLPFGQPHHHLEEDMPPPQDEDEDYSDD